MKKKIDIATLSQREAEDKIRLENIIQVKSYKKPVMISITSPLEPSANIKYDLPILRLEFDDVEHTEDLLKEVTNTPLKPISKEQVIQIFDFIEFEKPDLVITHCKAGVCRSAAVNAALSKIFTQSDDWYFKNKVPNMRVYKMMLEYWYCDLLATCNAKPELSAKGLHPFIYAVHTSNLSKIH